MTIFYGPSWPSPYDRLLAMEKLKRMPSHNPEDYVAPRTLHNPCDPPPTPPLSVHAPTKAHRKPRKRTEEFSLEDIAEAIRGYFDLPADAEIKFEYRRVAGVLGEGAHAAHYESIGHEVFVGVKATYIQ